MSMFNGNVIYLYFGKMAQAHAPNINHKTDVDGQRHFECLQYAPMEQKFKQTRYLSCNLNDTILTIANNRSKCMNEYI
jgi:hypothetical protein